MNHCLDFEAATPHSCSYSSCCRGLTSRKEHPGASSSPDSLPHPVPDLHQGMRKGILRTGGCSCVLWTCCVGGKGYVTRMHPQLACPVHSSTQGASARVNKVKMHAFGAWEHHCRPPDTPPACPITKMQNAGQLTMRCPKPCRPCVVGWLWVPVRSGKGFRGLHVRARELRMVMCSNKGCGWHVGIFVLIRCGPHLQHATRPSIHFTPEK